MKRLVTIVTPVFNEEEAIPIYYKKITEVLATCEDRYDFEIVFTNNASTDGTVEVIRSLRTRDERVKLLSFSRNFGYQSSLLGGLTHARGDAIVIIDVDGEDPPELIPSFIEKWEAGYEVVYGKRGGRAEPWFLTQMRFLFYRILRWLADSDIILDMAEFSLFTRNVRNSILKSTNTFPFLRAEIAYSGFKKFGIAYDRQPRWAGRSHYNIPGMVTFAIAGILTISTFPLRFLAYFLPFLVLLNLAIGAWSLFIGRPWLLVGLIWFNSLFVSVAVVLSGIYLARVYKNGLQRSVFIVDWSQTWL